MEEAKIKKPRVYFSSAVPNVRLVLRELEKVMLPELSMIVAYMSWSGDTSWIESEEDAKLALTLCQDNEDWRLTEVLLLIFEEYHHLYHDVVRRAMFHHDVVHHDVEIMIQPDQAWCAQCVKNLLCTSMKNVQIMSSEAANALLAHAKESKWTLIQNVNDIRMATDHKLLAEAKMNCTFSNLTSDDASLEFLRVFGDAMTPFALRINLDMPNVRQWLRENPAAALTACHKPGLFSNAEMFKHYSMEDALESRMLQNDTCAELEQYFASDRKSERIDAVYLRHCVIRDLFFANGMDKASNDEIVYMLRNCGMSGDRLDQVMLEALKRNIPLPRLHARCGVDFWLHLPHEAHRNIGLTTLKAMAEAGVPIHKLEYAECLAKSLCLEQKDDSIKLLMFHPGALKVILKRQPSLTFTPWQIKNAPVKDPDDLFDCVSRQGWIREEKYLPLIMSLGMSPEALTGRDYILLDVDRPMMTAWLLYCWGWQRGREPIVPLGDFILEDDSYVRRYLACINGDQDPNTLDDQDCNVVLRHILWCKPLERVEPLWRNLDLDAESLTWAIQNPDKRVGSWAMNMQKQRKQNSIMHSLVMLVESGDTEGPSRMLDLMQERNIYLSCEEMRLIRLRPKLIPPHLMRRLNL